MYCVAGGAVMYVEYVVAGVGDVVVGFAVVFDAAVYVDDDVVDVGGRAGGRIGCVRDVASCWYIAGDANVFTVYVDRFGGFDSVGVCVGVCLLVFRMLLSLLVVLLLLLALLVLPLSYMLLLLVVLPLLTRSPVYSLMLSVGMLVFVMLMLVYIPLMCVAVMS